MIRRLVTGIGLLVLLVLASSLSAQTDNLAALAEYSAPTEAGPGSITVAFRIPEGHYQAYTPEFFGLRPAPGADFRLGEIEYPLDGGAGDESVKFRGEVRLSAPLFLTETGGAETGQTGIVAFYQICQDDGLCLYPREELLALPSNAAGPAETSSLVQIAFYLLLALMGGLLLNVMPCVLPVLSIKALNLLNQSQDDNRVIRNHALTFGAGIVLSLFVLGLVIAAIKSAGEAIGWGFQFQNPYYVFTLIAILIVFALSLFDLWILNLTFSGSMGRASSLKGYGGSFATGVLTVLLATPCTAPFLGTALGFAFSQSPALIILIFLAIGLGLALPFTLLGFFPGLIRRLPKPGPWMERFKEAMAFLLLATAAWLTGVLVKQLGGESVSRVLFLLLGVAALTWVWGKFGQGTRSRRLRRGIGALTLLLLLASPLLLPIPGEGDANAAGNPSAVPAGWRPFSGVAVQEARSAGNPVFIQFTADWCLTCRTNELTVFSRDDIEALFERYQVIRFYGDYTNNDEEIGSWIERFGKAGVPVYALYPPGAAEPVLLGEILTPGGFSTTLTNYLAW